MEEALRVVRAVAAVLLLAVSAAAQARPFHFAHDVQPWLARQGCAAADCHGGATGRGGFKLSLFGGDPRADHRAITVDRDGRRLDLRAPERSLLLRKPTHDLEHGGGRRLTRDSNAWNALRAWVADGAPFGRGDRAEIEQLELRVDDDRLRVTARFVWTDPGSGEAGAAAEDVSDRALFSTSAPDVVDVERSGRLVRRGSGEAWLFARFAGKDARLRVVEPFGEIPDAGTGGTPVDRAWRAGLAEFGLHPAPATEQDQMVRRLYLDLAGRLPAPAERRAFLELPEERRVPETVDRLLTSDDFTDVAAGWLARWFEVADPTAPATDDRMRARAAPLRADLRRVAAADASLLDAVASRVDDPLLERMPDPRDRAELFGRAVLGVRLGCARCHDHPLDRWTRADHLGFAALFVDPRPAADAGMAEGLLFDPMTGDPATPRVLPILQTDTDRSSPLRAQLAAALQDNPRWFARNVANRVFAELLGRGLVEPVEDHRPTNPGAHPALLDELRAGFQRAGYRLRPLVRAIATSELYARTTAPAADPLDGARARHLARREARPMPEALLRRAVARALAVPPGRTGPPSASPLAAWLALWNGADVQTLLDAEGSALDLLADLVDDDGERLESLFEVLLTRAPTDGEREHLLPVLRASNDPRQALRSVAHAIVLSREFTSIR